jgi:hypothetical protein
MAVILVTSSLPFAAFRQLDIYVIRYKEGAASNQLVLLARASLCHLLCDIPIPYKGCLSSHC